METHIVCGVRLGGDVSHLHRFPLGQHGRRNTKLRLVAVVESGATWTDDQGCVRTDNLFEAYEIGVVLMGVAEED